MEQFSHDSERVFAEYLDKHGIGYKRNFVVDPGDVDFYIKIGDSEFFSDVKAVEAIPEVHGKIDAHYTIRGHLRALRRKFKNAPGLPCVLVTMNYSPQLITGLTIRMAMLGDLGVDFVFADDVVSASEMAHKRKGDAALTRNHSTSISGVAVFDCAHGGPHCFFPNPYAKLPLMPGIFPKMEMIEICRTDQQETFLNESAIMFYPCRPI